MAVAGPSLDSLAHMQYGARSQRQSPKFPDG